MSVYSGTTRRHYENIAATLTLATFAHSSCFAASLEDQKQLVQQTYQKYVELLNKGEL